MSDSEGSGSSGELPNQSAEPPLFIDDTGDYGYLSEAYYRSQDLEFAGKTVIPSCIEALDAFTPPLLLLKASLCGIPVAPHRLVNDAFHVALPALLISVGVTTPRYRVAAEPAALHQAARELSHKGMYPVLAEQLDAHDTVREFLVAKGRTRHRADARLAEQFFAAFRVPLARLLVIDGASGLRLAAALPVLHARRVAMHDAAAEQALQPASAPPFAVRARLTRAVRM
ncbi:MAG: RimK-like ATPgrasp N-terminal domain-containing protein [Planctomycetota bacterium]